MPKRPRPRGFAALSPAERSRISRLGGRAVGSKRGTFADNPELARAAAKKSAEARKRNRLFGKPEKPRLIPFYNGEPDDE